MTARSLSPGAWRLVERFGQARVLVVGDPVLDVWIHGSCSAVSREAPVPAVDVAFRSNRPGGAANSAANIAGLGGRVRLVGAAGSDERADILTELLQQSGVGTTGLLHLAGRSTRTKCRIVADQQVIARFDEGDVGPLDRDADAAVARQIEEGAREAHAVLLADYGGGVLAGERSRLALSRVAAQRPVVVDAHDPARWRSLRAAVVKPNWQEAARVVGGSAARSLQPDASGRITAAMQLRRPLLQRTGAAAAVLTLDADGAVVLPSAGPALHLPAPALPSAHPAGAGDSFAAAMVLALALGGDLATACELGVAAGSAAAAKPGTAACTREDLQPAHTLVPLRELQELCGRHRAAGRSIVLTNGCFDVLHAGHIACLAAAAEQGDVVVVGLNDDAGVAALKGPGRPVNPLADRAAVLAALGTVDHIVAYSEPSAVGLVEALRPDVYLKGADHDVARLPEAVRARRYGARIVTVPLLPQRSTSAVIAAIAGIGAR